MATDYVDKCEECLKVYQEKQCGGCVHHPVPRYTRRGNVAYCPSVTDTILYIKNNNSHTVSGACHLLPSNVRAICDYCVARNDVFGLEIYILLLLSIDCFLRKSEYTSLKGENVVMKIFCLYRKFLEGIVDLKKFFFSQHRSFLFLERDLKKLSPDCCPSTTTTPVSP